MKKKYILPSIADIEFETEAILEKSDDNIGDVDAENFDNFDDDNPDNTGFDFALPDESANGF